MLEQAAVLERLIDDLRTLALADAASLVLAREPVDLGALVAETIPAFGAAADAGRVVLRTDVPSDPPTVDADPVRLRSVLGGLVSNALRHTPAGGSVTVRVGRSADALATVEVADTGTGIAAELLPRVFERFARGTESPGSGLGLAIARDIVAAHGGDITAASPTQGHSGTTITIRLPLAD
jgi:two-component system sensor histidine kinase BaeS